MNDINGMMKYGALVNGFGKYNSRKRKSTMKPLSNVITSDGVNQQDGKENSVDALDNVKQPSPMAMFNGSSEPIWSGIFKINNEACLKVDAHLSSKACKKVEECSRSLQPVLEVVKLPRLQVWRKGWESLGPTDACIGLYFFSSNSGSNEVSDELVNEVIETDSALKVTVAIADLLIFPSVVLPEQNQLYHGKHYLWGLFRQRNDISDEVLLGGEQNGSTCAVPMDEGGQQAQHLLNQVDQAQPASSEQITCAMNDSHVENPPLVESTCEAQIDEAMDCDIVVLGGEQNGSACAVPVDEGGQQAQHLSNQVDEARPASLQKMACAMNDSHVENPPLVQSTCEGQIDEAMQTITGEYFMTLPGSSLYGTKHPNSPKAVSNCSVHHPEEVSQPGDTFTSSSTKPNASTSVAAQLAEMTGHGQSCSGSEHLTAKLFGLWSRHYCPEATTSAGAYPGCGYVATEGALVVSVPAEMVTTDYVSGNSPAVGAGLNPVTDHQQRFEGEPSQPDVAASQACLELFPVTQEQMGLAAPRVGTSNIMEVDLEMSLGMPVVLHL
ncbi:uncharacterized protein LOC8079854 [Sorghum bicolor]|uniref:AIPP2-like SPOC-like domain-containing protein n=1 Tax=Sorghum bicolor TaxID=4558 RepID=A0A1B6PB90_SORBI|nr:uncharacterized protein LOC8079854 [Sorghum bicolor]KXG23020.1 hypothetical protein SORBI_3008G045700 [Sorghum bicolor]OQU78774.1 hypothetical protein SORBI_3008G045700 [Sorghum bicolor]|eukprot:XP_002442855.2 uncharacterized protein LOC8079854 [Sorghum bicolor]